MTGTFLALNWGEWVLVGLAACLWVFMWLIHRAPLWPDDKPPLEWEVYDQEPVREVRETPPDFGVTVQDDWSGWGSR